MWFQTVKSGYCVSLRECVYKRDDNGRGRLWWLSGEESTCQCRRHRFDPWVGKIPWRRKWQPTPVFLLGKIPWTEEPGGLRSRWKWSHSVVSNSLCPHGLWPARLLCPWDFPGKYTGVGCHFLLQRIFSTQGSNLGVPHCKQTLYCLSHQVVPGCSPGGPKMSDTTWQLKNNSGRSLSTWLKTSPS